MITIFVVPYAFTLITPLALIAATLVLDDLYVNLPFPSVFALIANALLPIVFVSLAGAVIFWSLAPFAGDVGSAGLLVGVAVCSPVGVTVGSTVGVAVGSTVGVGSGSLPSNPLGVGSCGSAKSSADISPTPTV